MKVAVWEIRESREALYSKLRLDAGEKRYLESLGNHKRYLHWLSSRVLIRSMIGTTEFIDLKTDTNGKPGLVNFPHRISISHSHQMAAVILSDRHDVGIDIERIDPKVMRIEQKFLSAGESEFIDRGREAEHLIACWCAKETLFKLYGRGGVDYRRDLFLGPFKPADSGLINAKVNKADFSAEVQVSYARIGEYHLAYAVADFG